MYVHNDPVDHTDRSGLLIDTIADAAFVLWDIYDIISAEDPYDRSQSITALKLDILGATIPMATGLGGGYRAAKGLQKGVCVIGPRNTYREFAKEIGAKFLDVTDEAWTWEKNRRFLYNVVNRGDNVVFAGKFNPAKLDPNSVLAREIRYLTERGYRWTDDYSRLVKQ